MKKVILALALLLLLPVSAEASPRIVNGTPAAMQQWPFMVALREKGNRVPYCGGVLVDRKWVLTAAHCVAGDGGRPVPASSMDLIFGQQDASRPTSGAPVERIIAHPGYYSDTRTKDDIALLELRGLRPEESVARVAADSALYSGRAEIAGYGQNCPVGNECMPTGYLLAGQGQILSEEECADKFDDARERGITCFRGDRRLGGVQDVCFGDSGGPLVRRTGTNGTVVGLASFLGGEECASGEPTAFTNVSSYWRWISRWINDSVRMNPRRPRLQMSGRETPSRLRDTITLFNTSSKWALRIEAIWVETGSSQGCDFWPSSLWCEHTFSDDFEIRNNRCNGWIEPSGSCTFEVSFIENRRLLPGAFSSKVIVAKNYRVANRTGFSDLRGGGTNAEACLDRVRKWIGLGKQSRLPRLCPRQMNILRKLPYPYYDPHPKYYDPHPK